MIKLDCGEREELLVPENINRRKLEEYARVGIKPVSDGSSTTDIGPTDIATTDIVPTVIGTTDIGTTDIGTTDITIQLISPYN